MADQDNFAPRAGASSTEPRTKSGNRQTVLDNDQLSRLAELVASGEMTPVSAARDLSPESCQQLETIVRNLLRARLVRFIAQQIAMGIHLDRSARSESTV